MAVLLAGRLVASMAHLLAGWTAAMLDNELAELLEPRSAACWVALMVDVLADA